MHLTHGEPVTQPVAAPLRGSAVSQRDVAGVALTLELADSGGSQLSTDPARRRPGAPPAPPRTAALVRGLLSVERVVRGGVGTLAQTRHVAVFHEVASDDEQLAVA